MKHLKWFLSLVFTLVVLGMYPAALVYAQEQSLHPFNGTEQLIQDAVENLREQGKTMVEKEIDPALVESVENDSAKTFSEVKTVLGTRFIQSLGEGEIDVTDLNLSEGVLEKVISEVLYDNFMYKAISDISYSTENSKVSRITFNVSEGYESAMKAITGTFDYKLETSYTPEGLEGLDEVELFPSFPQRHSRSAATYALSEEAETSNCKNHTASGIPQLLGDLNKDGKVNVKDIGAVRRLVTENVFDKVADANKDGKLNVRDIAALRQMLLSGNFENVEGDAKVDFTWKLAYDYTPVFKTNADGEMLDKNNNVVTDPAKAEVLNGGLLYNPETKEITEGILPDVYWTLDKISFHCTECGQDIVLTSEDNAEALNNMVQRYEIYLDQTKVDPQTGEMMEGAMIQVPLGQKLKDVLPPAEDGADPENSEEAEDPEKELLPDGKTPRYLHVTQVSVAQFADDSFSIDEETGQPVLDGTGKPIGLYVDTNGDNNDNGSEKVKYYYNILSAFIGDHAEYYGISTDYWTSMNSEANPMAAVKALCNIQPDLDIPPAIMGELIQMLPQAFMAYVHYYGGELLSMRDQALQVMNQLPADATYVQKLLILHDWLAENSIFDMGSMVTVNESGGSPETDPIQMTPFGSMLSNQLTQISQKGYYGCICLGYASAYTYLIQNAFPDIYRDAEGNWLNPEQLKGKHVVDFGQVMFYSNTEESSVAGEGFGGGFFNNVHYYNLVKVDEAPTTKVKPVPEKTEHEDRRYGNWFFVDTCYDDIFVECLTQYRSEADGSMYHDYFLVSPQTMGKIWNSSIDYINHLYDGYTYQIKRDLQGNPVPYPVGDPRYNENDKNHPMYEKVKNEDELFNDNTCYENTWFSASVSKICHNGENWYYIDAESNSTGMAEMVDENGELKDKEKIEQHNIDFRACMHNNRVDVEKQNKLKTRSMDDPDYWNKKEDSDSGMGGMMGEDKSYEYKKDPYATVLFDYGTGKFPQNSKLSLTEEVQRDFTYREQYPGLTHCLSMYYGKLYFNLANKLYEFDAGAGTCNVVREYHKVTGTSDGRPYTASSYKVDPDGSDIVSYEGPVAGMSIRKEYIPLYDYLDKNGKVTIRHDGHLGEGYSSMQEAQGASVERKFFTMASQDTLTVNIASNLSFSAGFKKGMTDEELSNSRYTNVAKNFNSDYSKWVDECLDDGKEDKNNNEEFLWCANIREDIPMEEFVPSSGGEVTVACAGYDTGHNYVYDEHEECYICQNCHLHAKNVIQENPNFITNMYCQPKDASGKMGSMGGGEKKEFITPVNQSREAAVTADGKILVEAKPAKDGNKLATGISFLMAGEPETEAAVITAVEDEKFVLDKAKEKIKGCISVDVIDQAAYKVDVKEAEHGTVTPDKSLVPEGSTVKLTVTPDVGFGLKSLDVVVNASGATVLVTPENTFTMPASNVTVTPSFAEAYDVVIEETTNGTVSYKYPSAVVGSVVTLSVQANEGYQLGELKVVRSDNNSAVSVDKRTTSFTMPESAVKVSATFKLSTEVTYNVVVDGGICDKTEGYASGDTVVITANELDGKEFVKWKTKDKDVHFKNSKSKETTFTMPNHAVGVQAVFKNTEEVKPKPEA